MSATRVPRVGDRVIPRPGKTWNRAPVPQTVHVVVEVVDPRRALRSTSIAEVCVVIVPEPIYANLRARGDAHLMHEPGFPVLGADELDPAPRRGS